MFFNLPIEIQRYIFSFDPTYRTTMERAIVDVIYQQPHKILERFVQYFNERIFSVEYLQLSKIHYQINYKSETDDGTILSFTNNMWLIDYTNNEDIIDLHMYCEEFLHKHIEAAIPSIISEFMNIDFETIIAIQDLIDQEKECHVYTNNPIMNAIGVKKWHKFVHYYMSCLIEDGVSPAWMCYNLEKETSHLDWYDDILVTNSICDLLHIPRKCEILIW